MRADGRRVALKVIAPEHTYDVEFERRFSRGAKLAEQLNHPHIVPVIDTGRTTDGLPDPAFAYIDGTDLDHGLRKSGALQPKHAARTITQIASALG